MAKRRTDERLHAFRVEIAKVAAGKGRLLTGLERVRDLGLLLAFLAAPAVGWLAAHVLWIIGAGSVASGFGAVAAFLATLLATLFALGRLGPLYRQLRRQRQLSFLRRRRRRLLRELRALPPEEAGRIVHRLTRHADPETTEILAPVVEELGADASELAPAAGPGGRGDEPSPG